MEHMNPLDASFLYIEDGITHMHIASCAVFAGPVPDYAQVVEAMASKLPLVPRYRQVVRFVPFELGRPVWEDDPHFRLEYHVRHTALPRPGGPKELRDLMGRLMSQELDRHRPLWEVWMVEGLEDDKWGLVTKIHHCMADGVSGTDLLSVVLDREPVPTPVTVDTWVPAAPSSDLRLMLDAAWRLAVSPYEQGRALRRALRAPRRAVAAAGGTARGLWSLATRLAPTPRTSLVGTISPYRRWTWATADLADIKAIKRAFGGTVNDVILAVITGGFRELLLTRREAVDGLVLRSLVPVSVRSDAQRGQYNNLVSAMFADLPVAIADPVERLAAVREQMQALKQSDQTSAGSALVALGDLAPTGVYGLAERAVMRVLRRVPQHSVNTVTTNVPGPQHPLYLAGRQMVEYLPFVPISYGVRVGVAIVSYNGRVAFGVTGDFDTAPDIDVLADGIEDGITELLKLSG